MGDPTLNLLFSISAGVAAAVAFIAVCRRFNLWPYRRANDTSENREP